FAAQLGLHVGGRARAAGVYWRFGVRSDRAPRGLESRRRLECAIDALPRQETSERGRLSYLYRTGVGGRPWKGTRAFYRLHSKPQPAQGPAPLALHSLWDQQSDWRLSGAERS